ncbi:hypothetical protein BS47DRAFT_1347039 [Hydnum rufescens UP504]|uniref:Dienelactone hydrolase domain-containing protein n=1 Tax=Hydnum rufescens UP504 TaxID=1448309 RepID=A0A9P6ASK4_9AGAM|nr:hypothetical protein BS47DRAFT_1347039 [Hydnum rufescens UP504]
MAEAGITRACCAEPATVSREYTLKGTYAPYAGFDKAYIVGPNDTKRAIIFTYDIFGFFPTTQQAADILADRLNAKVVMPDFAHGKPYDSTRYLNPPPDANVRKEVAEQFFAPKYLDDRVAEIKRVAVALKAEGKTFVGAIGLCWGGRLVLNVGRSPAKELDAVASNHPAALNQTDGDNLLVPVALYPSKDDQAELAETIVKNTKAKPFGAASDFKHFNNMHHGWSGAHAWLDREDNYAAYAEVYGRLSTFFDNASRVAAA